MRLVIALGGNALLRRGEKPDASVQLGHVEAVSSALARVAAQHEVVICHGNGPQVGLLSLESERDAALSRPYPLDLLGAETQGMIGYLLVQAIRNGGLTTPVVAVVTQTVVGADDPALSAPTKPVGPAYGHDEADRLAARLGWTVAADGARWRRVVASPEPVDVVELGTVAMLLDAGTTVVCAGGGGAPVSRDGHGRLHGVAAVVDKDLVAAWLAVALGADRLVVLTDVPAVMADFGTADARRVPRLDVDAVESSSYAVGSMGPKVEACRRFVATTGHPASIGAIDDLEAVLAGTAGTVVEPGAALPTSTGPSALGDLRSSRHGGGRPPVSNPAPAAP